MVKISHEFGRCVTELLKRHKLSTRACEVKVEGVVSNSYIVSMTHGKVPQHDTLVKFLSFFPVDEAIECMKAAGYPIPQQWLTPEQSVIEAVELAMRVSGKFDDVPQERREAAKTQIIDFINRMKDKYQGSE
jgi:predicted transcriptional regulator